MGYSTWKVLLLLPPALFIAACAGSYCLGFAITLSEQLSSPAAADGAPSAPRLDEMKAMDGGGAAAAASLFGGGPPPEYSVISPVNA